MKQRRSLQVETLEQRCLMAAQPLISEFSASNNGAIRDGFGDSSDWIEVYNAGDAAIDLAGYRLTDNLGNLNKWIFPSVNLAAGEYLVVFASGHGGVDPAGYLHTNFALAAAGEHVALVNPSGAIVSQHGPGGSMYPPQPEDDSAYGIAFDTVTTTVLSPTSPARYLIPMSGTVDGVWMQPGFDDSAWTGSTASVGYEVPAVHYAPLITTPLPVGTTTAYLRYQFNVSDADALIERLQLKYDDGFVAWLNGVEIARSNAPDQLGHNAMATTLRVREAALRYAPFDVRDHSHLLVPGTNVLAVQILNFGNDGDLLFVPHMTVVSGSPKPSGDVGPLLYPTPGLPNAPLLAGEVQFSRGSATFVDPFQLVLTSTQAGDVIRYTTNGTEPGPTSPIYTAPLSITGSTQIRARAYGEAGRVGNIRTEAFSKLDAEHVGFTSDLPIIVLDNFGIGYPHRWWQASHFTLYDVDPATGVSDISAEPDVTTRAAQHRRGTTSYSNPKYSLRIELRDEAGEDKDIGLLGMPAESDWILYGAYNTDRSLIRNPLWYDLAAQVGGYAVKTRYVELFSNHDGGAIDANDYMGVYALIETIKVDADRLDIEKLGPLDSTVPDITGGYVFKIDREVDDEDADWNTPRGTPHNTPVFVHVSPERWELTTQQTNYLRNYINQFENVLYGANFRHPTTGYAAYIDVDSFVDHFLLRTFSKEKDGLVLSEFFYKDRNGKLHMGPVWDFDLSSGHADDLTRGPEGWSWRSEDKPWYGTWFGRLFEDAAFIQKVIDRWQELRTTVFSNENLIATVENHAGQIAAAQVRNHERWPESLNTGGMWADPGLTGWEAGISSLKNWLLLRAEWLDTRMPTPPLLSVTHTGTPGELEITMQALQVGSEIYYTLDGREPYNPNWTVAPYATLYTGPFTVPEGTQLNARVRNTTPITYWPWSSPVGGNLTLAVPAASENLRLTELHYHPSNPSAAELATMPGVVDNEFEFLELTNVGSSWVTLAGLTFTSGIEFSFADASITQLAPGKSLVLVSNTQAFKLRYGTQIPIAGEYEGQLGNSDDQITLVGALGDEIFHISYLDRSPWPSAPDGDGPSLEILDPRLEANQSVNWRASRAPHGSPGVATRWGDFDGSGTVDTADYQLWKSTFGQTVTPFTGGDSNGDGVVDVADFTAWRNHLGQSLPAALAFAIETASDEPTEPAALYVAPGTLPAPHRQARGEPIRRGAYTDAALGAGNGADAKASLLLIREAAAAEAEARGEWRPELREAMRPADRTALEEAFALEQKWGLWGGEFT